MIDLKELGQKWKHYISPYKKNLEKERMWEIFNFYASADVLFFIFSYVALVLFLLWISMQVYSSVYVVDIIVGILVFLVSLCILTTINFLREKKLVYFKIKDRKVFKDFFHKVFGDIMFMQKTCFFNVQELEESKIFKYPIQTISSDDNFYGYYKNVKYKISEVKLDNYFKGLIFAFEFNKKMDKTLVISPKTVPCINSFLPYFVEIIVFLLVLYYLVFLSNYLLVEKVVSLFFVLFFAFVFIYLNKKKKLEPVFTESVDFEKKYSILSDSQIESRYIVTPSFIESFLNLEKTFNTDKISCSVCNDTIIFAIENEKDFFEFDSIFIPIDDERHILHFYKELNVIISIIDSLKIDENIKL